MAGGTAIEWSAAYSGASNSVRWEGRLVKGLGQFRRYLCNVVRPRLTDEESSFDGELRGLATTGVETRFVERVLQAVPEPKAWEIGEAFAECVLRDDPDREVHWPWNTVRDRRTPRASLPGADLVGFCRDGANVFLLIGEVKTSSDSRRPPNVMTGGGGMAWQLERTAARADVQLALLRWLHARCDSAFYGELFQKASERYIASGGKSLVLVGVLLRDTAPSELDLKASGEALAERSDEETRIDLAAWYLPVPIVAWPALVREVGS